MIHHLGKIKNKFLNTQAKNQAFSILKPSFKHPPPALYIALQGSRKPQGL